MTIERNVDLPLFCRPPALLLRHRSHKDIEKEMKRSENPDYMDADEEEVA
ncbi:hypothetical protein Hanom_Chr10g00900851 [Helianthus anomalus]